MWIRSINMNSGYLNTNSSNARLWSEFIFTNVTAHRVNGRVVLNKNLPSPAEALAVMAGCTLLLSVQDAPFVEFFNYSAPDNILRHAETQIFNASVHQQQYASGGTAAFDRGFLVVLLVVFLINVFILVYWLWQREWFIDFSEPINLFDLAINSPPSEKSVNTTSNIAVDNVQRFRERWKVVNTMNELVLRKSPALGHEGLGSGATSPDTPSIRNILATGRDWVSIPGFRRRVHDEEIPLDDRG